jgi:hypothetical protein
MNSGTIPSKSCGQCGERFDGKKRSRKWEDMEAAFVSETSNDGVKFYIKKYTESLKFKPHYNSEMGKYYDTKKEYFDDMKAKGLEPYRGDNVNKREPKSYTPSKQCREITNTLERVGLTGSVKVALAKMGIKVAPKDLNSSQGGWN